MSERYFLRCLECQKDWGNRPTSICEDCLAPLAVVYDYDAIRREVSRDEISRRPANLWRYAELLPLPEDFKGTLSVGGTPLHRADRLAKELGVRNLFVKNDAVCFPTLSFK